MIKRIFHQNHETIKGQCICQRWCKNFLKTIVSSFLFLNMNLLIVSWKIIAYQLSLTQVNNKEPCGSPISNTNQYDPPRSLALQSLEINNDIIPVDTVAPHLLINFQVSVNVLKSFIYIYIYISDKNDSKLVDLIKQLTNFHTQILRRVPSQLIWNMTILLSTEYTRRGENYEHFQSK